MVSFLRKEMFVRQVLADVQCLQQHGGMSDRDKDSRCLALSLQNCSQHYLLLENSYIVAVIYDFRKHVHISLFDATSREMPQTGGGTLYGGSLLWMAMAMITVSSTLVFYNSR